MFFEAVRIIKEMRDATNSIYPRATIWENVPGALSSNKGADFGVVLSSLADIGAITQEYAVLDAQYFRSTPQRRRRIFLVSIFDPAASERCPDPLLPLIQGSRGDFAKGRKARKDAARLTEASVDPGDGKEIAYTLLNFAEYGEGIGTLRATGGDLGGGSETLVAAIDQVNMPISELGPTLTTTYGAKNYSNHQEVISGSVIPVMMPFVKSRRAQTNTDDETWVEGEVTPTLNAFDNGGETRATVLMPFVFDATRHDDFRMDTETVPTLKQRMGTGGGQVPMLAEPIAYDDLNATVSTVHGTLRVKRNGDFIAEPIVYDGYNQKLDDSGIHRSLRIGRDSSDFIAQPTYSFDTQFGSNASVFEDHSPTLKSSQQPPSVAMAFSHYSSDASPSIEISPTLRSGTNGTGHAILTSPGLAVRRLTPLECERLQGWPDDHTRWTADGKEQADTNRYKQCGNGVASPCAAWVGEQLRPVLETT